MWTPEDDPKDSFGDVSKDLEHHPGRTSDSADLPVTGPGEVEPGAVSLDADATQSCEIKGRGRLGV